MFPVKRRPPMHRPGAGVPRPPIPWDGRLYILLDWLCARCPGRPGIRLRGALRRWRVRQVAGPDARVCGCGDDASAAAGGDGERCEFCRWWAEVYPPAEETAK